MIYIDRTGHLPGEDWLNRAERLTRQLIGAPNNEARFRIIDANESLWGELKDFLLRISTNKCWYSEARDSYAHYHVDHFRPKKEALGLDKMDYGGYWWLAFDWTNYRLCGGAGNVRKGAKFAVRAHKANTPDDMIDDEIIFLLDPCDEEDILKVTFNDRGYIVPISVEGWDFERANYTIDSLNLNFKLLQESRQLIWAKCFAKLKETQNLMFQNELTPSAYRRGLIKEKIKEIKEMVKPTSEFSATVKACLLSSGLPWASGIISY